MSTEVNQTIAELKQASDEAIAAYDAAVQARRVAEFEHMTAEAEAKEANRRHSKARGNLDKVREIQFAASKTADEAFFKLAQAQMAENGSVKE